MIEILGLLDPGVVNNELAGLFCISSPSFGLMSSRCYFTILNSVDTRNPVKPKLLRK